MGLWICFIKVSRYVYTKSPQKEITGKVVEEIEEIPAIQQGTTCEDSDYGKAYGVIGNVVYCENGKCSDEKDYCSSKKLTEWYCEKNQKKSIEYECEFSCDDGACVSLATKYESEYTTVSRGGGGGGSGGDGASGTGFTEGSGTTYELGSLISEQTIYPSKNDNIKFNLVADYTLTISDNSKTQITISVVGTSQSFMLNVRDDNNLDLNQDTINDIYMKIVSINAITGKIEIKIRPSI